MTRKFDQQLEIYGHRTTKACFSGVVARNLQGGPMLNLAPLRVILIFAPPPPPPQPLPPNPSLKKW